MVSLSDTNQTDSIEALNSTSRYLDDLLKISSLDFYSEAITHEILQHTQKYCSCAKTKGNTLVHKECTRFKLGVHY